MLAQQLHSLKKIERFIDLGRPRIKLHTVICNNITYVSMIITHRPNWIQKQNFFNSSFIWAPAINNKIDRHLFVAQLDTSPLSDKCFLIGVRIENRGNKYFYTKLSYRCK